MINVSLVMEFESFSAVALHAACISVRNLAQLLVYNLIDDCRDNKIFRLEVLVREGTFLAFFLWTDILYCLTE